MNANLHPEINHPKYDRLLSILNGYSNLLIAYSGGVDSTFLLKVASDVLGDKALGLIGISPSLPQREMKEAIRIAANFGFRVHTIETHELEDENYTKNPHNRCYYCKKELFSEIYDYAREHGFQFIADGTNADDEGDHRPGMQAAREFQVCSPLKEARLTKEDIRQLSKSLGLPTWNKPEMACLASRFPTGVAISVEKLSRVETAEDFLRNLGFHQMRVRHHENIARIELAADEMEKIMTQAIRDQVNRFFKHLGYQFVTLDLSGYRRGSLNPQNKVPKKSDAERDKINRE